MVRRTHAMPRSDDAQPSICSGYARDCGREIARRTGMSTTEIVEDALRGYVPPGDTGTVGGLIRRGRVLVKPAQGRRVTHNEVEQALEAVRGRDL